jgi:hypothetical protein
MQDLFSRFTSNEIIGLIAVAGAFLCGIPAIIGGLWLEIRKAELAAALKQDMLNRGMSADEIRTVLDAGTGLSQKALAARNRCGP